jgi:hypothetical protein
MAKMTLAELRSRMKQETQKSSGPSNYYPFFNMKENEQAVIRFLPDKNEDNPNGFYITKFTHELLINGEKKRIACRSMYADEDGNKEACPICELSQQYFKKEDKQNGLKFWKKKQYLANVLIVTDPLPADKETKKTNEGTVKILSFGKKIYESINDAIDSGEIEELPYSYEAGTDFIIKKTKNGDHAAYERSKFARNPSELDEETIAHVEEAIIDLSTLIPKDPGYDKLEAMLDAHLTGASYREDGESDEDEPPAPRSKKPARDEDEDDAPPRKAAKPARDEDDEDEPPAPRSKKPARDEDEDDAPPRKSKPAPAADADDEDAEAEALLATIRNRNRK